MTTLKKKLDELITSAAKERRTVDEVQLHPDDHETFCADVGLAHADEVAYRSTRIVSRSFAPRGHLLVCRDPE